MSNFRRLYVAANVPLRHQNFLPKDSKSKEWTKIYEATKGRIDTDAILAFLGQRGCGKTQMGSCLIGYCCQSLERPAKYAKASDIFTEIRGAMKDKETSESASIKKYVAPYLLVIDAYELRTPDSDFEARMITLLIDKRYDDLKPTIIISNDSPELFERQIGASVSSRIVHTGGIVEFKNIPSFREQK